RDWHTGSADVALPRTKSDIQQQELTSAIPQDGSQALMVSRPHRGRPSNHERVLTPRGTPPLAKGRSAFRRSRNPGGDHFVPHPLTHQPPAPLSTASKPDLPLPGGDETAPAQQRAPKTNAAA